MNKLVLSFLLVICLLSCKQKSVYSSFEIEDKEALVTKLADMYFMEAFLARSNKATRDSLRGKMKDEFYQLHGITVKDLDVYLNNLKQDPKTFGEIMDSVSFVLNKKSKEKKK